MGEREEEERRVEVETGRKKKEKKMEKGKKKTRGKPPSPFLSLSLVAAFCFLPPFSFQRLTFASFDALWLLTPLPLRSSKKSDEPRPLEAP